jgi:Ni2+-binding GTPase involved in maturation of urease and hydrogenase
MMLAEMTIEMTIEVTIDPDHNTTKKEDEMIVILTDPNGCHHQEVHSYHSRIEKLDRNLDHIHVIIVESLATFRQIVQILEDRIHHQQKDKSTSPRIHGSTNK